MRLMLQQRKQKVEKGGREKGQEGKENHWSIINGQFSIVSSGDHRLHVGGASISAY